jgi:predicted Fe-Mo cluster-binding NifX family protein
MKLAVASSGSGLDSPVDLRFGRCPWFVIVDTDTMNFEAVPNPAAGAAGGAGIQAAQMLLSKGVNAVVAGQVGPNAFQVLSAAGVQVLPFAGGTVKDAVDAFLGGRLSETSAPTASAHAGMAPQDPSSGFPGAGPGMGFGRGMGRGGGRGRGRGRRCW